MDVISVRNTENRVSEYEKDRENFKDIKICDYCQDRLKHSNNL